jgi:general secretion pathway protein G
MHIKRVLLAIFVIFFLCIVVDKLRWNAQIERSRRIAADIHALDVQLEAYKSKNGSFPTTQEGLAVLGKVPKDPWLSDYVYHCPGSFHRDRYDLFSLGADRRSNTPDDDWGDTKQ